MSARQIIGAVMLIGFVVMGTVVAYRQGQLKALISGAAWGASIGGFLMLTFWLLQGRA